MTALLDIRNVTVRFDGVTALDNVSLTIATGTLLGFIGPNGAGKTTLMRAITGLVKPDHGEIVFEGQAMTSWPTPRRIRAGLGLAQQLVRPFRSMTLMQNVMTAAGFQHTSNPLRALFRAGRAAEQQKAIELLDKVGIKAVPDAMPSELPLGMLKRLEVARALALDPKLLLLDEPLAGLNQKEANEMADFIAALWQAGQSILLIEHNLREVMRICPELYVQHNGRRLALGPTQDVMANAQVREAYLGRS